MCSPFLKFNSTRWAELKDSDPPRLPSYRAFTRRSAETWRTFSDPEKLQWTRACLGEPDVDDCEECLKRCAAASPPKLSPFLRFSQQHRSEYKGLNMFEIAKRLGQRWRAMSKAERAAYAS